MYVYMYICHQVQYSYQHSIIPLLYNVHVSYCITL